MKRKGLPKGERVFVGHDYAFWVKENGDFIIRNNDLPNNYAYALKKPSWNQWWVMVSGRKIEPLYSDYSPEDVANDLYWINQNVRYASG